MQTQDLTPEVIQGHEILEAAVRVATKHHMAQVRKGTRVPYISHLLQVAGMVLEFGGGLVEAAAGVLHDILEDTGIGVETLREELESNAPGNPFIGPVLEIVSDCTDTSEGQGGSSKEPWMVRKTRHLDRLQSISPQQRSSSPATSSTTCGVRLPISRPRDRRSNSTHPAPAFGFTCGRWRSWGIIFHTGSNRHSRALNGSG